MLESCGPGTIPGDPETIRAAARGLEQDADRAERGLLENIRLAREIALARWFAAAADEFDGYISGRLSFATALIDADREAAQILYRFADELQAAKHAFKVATEHERSAERERDSAESGSPEQSAAADALYQARGDKAGAGQAAEAANEHAALALEGVIAGLPGGLAAPAVAPIPPTVAPIPADPRPPAQVAPPSDIEGVLQPDEYGRYSAGERLFFAYETLEVGLMTTAAGAITLGFTPVCVAATAPSAVGPVACVVGVGGTGAAATGAGAYSTYRLGKKAVTGKAE